MVAKFQRQNTGSPDIAWVRMSNISPSTPRSRYIENKEQKSIGRYTMPNSVVTSRKCIWQLKESLDRTETTFKMTFVFWGKVGYQFEACWLPDNVQGIRWICLIIWTRTAKKISCYRSPVQSIDQPPTCLDCIRNAHESKRESDGHKPNLL
jgi:hypothetical protein